MDAKLNRVHVIETEADTPPEVFDCVTIRTPLEAETVARVLAAHFGANQFKVIRQHSTRMRGLDGI